MNAPTIAPQDPKQTRIRAIHLMRDILESIRGIRRDLEQESAADPGIVVGLEKCATTLGWLAGRSQRRAARRWRR